MLGCFTVVFDFRESLQNLNRLAARRPENLSPKGFLNGLSNPTVKEKVITAKAAMTFLVERNSLNPNRKRLLFPRV